ncbi:MAG: hypothetical protein ACK41Q_01565 [Candidatus Brocadia sp.]
MLGNFNFLVGADSRWRPGTMNAGRRQEIAPTLRFAHQLHDTFFTMPFRDQG